MDIDIDCQTNFDPTTVFDVVQASMVREDKITGYRELIKHPVGVYFQDIAKDKTTGLCAIPYETAEELGYFKVDFLHLSALDTFTCKEEIRALAKIPPDWNLLMSRSIVGKLFQIANYFDIVNAIKPRSVQELADVIAILRPAKRNLLTAYLSDRDKIRPILYQKSNKYYFKRSHAISYAITIVLQLHLIKGGLL